MGPSTIRRGFLLLDFPDAAQSGHLLFDACGVVVTLGLIHAIQIANMPTQLQYEFAPT
jgi:hypothetical protein